MTKEFLNVSRITRTEVRANKAKTNQVSKIKFLTTYNPNFSQVSGIIKNINVVENTNIV